MSAFDSKADIGGMQFAAVHESAFGISGNSVAPPLT
jgi:hypothetical protein